LPKLEELLTAQAKAGAIQKKIESLAAELDGLILDIKRSFLGEMSPPMFSSQYFSQFGSNLWYESQRGIEEISWPGKPFFDRHGWHILLQVFLSLFVIIALYRKRQALRESKRWSFLAARPLSAGFFVAIMATLLFYYRDEGMPATWELATTIVGGVSFVRLFGSLITASWKMHFAYGLISAFILNRLVYVVNLPLPLVRVYIVLISLAGLFLCLRWARASRCPEESGFYPWLLRLVSFFFAGIMITEIWGKTNLPMYLLVSVVNSATMVLLFVLFMYMIRGAVEWMFCTSPLRRATVLNTDAAAIIRQVTRFIYFAILMLVLIPGILMIWGVYDNLERATKGVLALGFTIGSLRISMGLLITSAGILYGSFLMSWIFQKVLVDRELVRRQMESGVRLAIGRLVHYAFISAGFLLAISTLGVEITKITIMLSALGVGIGFGLQGVVNNFVSGLILLFERPVRVGDSIELNGKWSEIKKIGLRATTVRTHEDSDVIIPNADLISNHVTNWTLSNRKVRMIIPVGVAYGSDVPLVVETLMACAKANSMLAKTPEPQVLFLNFGESSLDFELRVWVLDVANRRQAQSELHKEIDRRFREAKIEIAFPQRDLHLRSVNESVTLRPPETPK
jgi:potassium efflux system protein